MKIQYKELKHPDTNETAAIQRTDTDGTIWSIPLDSNNSDYKRYLRWLENPEAEETHIEGNI